MLKKRIIFAVILLSLGVFYWLNPERVTFLPRCLFHWLTGWDCPACGTQRALYHFLHLNLKKAFSYNPFLFISLPYLIALVLCQWFNDKGALNKLKKICHQPVVVNTYLGLLIAWWVLRNFM